MASTTASIGNDSPKGIEREVHFKVPTPPSPKVRAVASAAISGGIKYLASVKEVQKAKPLNREILRLWSMEESILDAPILSVTLPHFPSHSGFVPLWVSWMWSARDAFENLLHEEEADSLAVKIFKKDFKRFFLDELLEKFFVDGRQLKKFTSRLIDIEKRTKLAKLSATSLKPPKAEEYLRRFLHQIDRTQASVASDIAIWKLDDAMRQKRRGLEEWLEGKPNPEEPFTCLLIRPPELEKQCVRLRPPSRIEWGGIVYILRAMTSFVAQESVTLVQDINDDGEETLFLLEDSGIRSLSLTWDDFSQVVASDGGSEKDKLLESLMQGFDSYLYEKLDETIAAYMKDPFSLS